MLASGPPEPSTRQPLPPLEAASRYRLRLEAQRVTHQSKGVIKAKQESPFAYIGSRPDCHADVSLCKRRSIIDSISNHCDLPTL